METSLNKNWPVHENDTTTPDVTFTFNWPNNNKESQDPQTQLFSSNGMRKRTQRREWGSFRHLALDIISRSSQSSNPLADIFGTNLYGVSEIAIEQPSVQISHTPPSTTSSPSNTSISTSIPERPRKKGNRRKHGSAPSRNIQVTMDQADQWLERQLSRCRIDESSRNLACPIVNCRYQQLNRRMPDFRRHVRTHFRKAAEIRCIGVPWSDFGRFRHLFPGINDGEQPYGVPNEEGLWIGGCLKTFSRADALKRHLRNSSCSAHNHNQSSR